MRKRQKTAWTKSHQREAMVRVWREVDVVVVVAVERGKKISRREEWEKTPGKDQRQDTE